MRAQGLIRKKSGHGRSDLEKDGGISVPLTLFCFASQILRVEQIPILLVPTETYCLQPKLGVKNKPLSFYGDLLAVCVLAADH